MSMWKRWTSGVVSRIDWAVTRVENHEAQIDSAIREVHAAGARAKVQLARVNRDGRKLRIRLADETEKETTWRERARSCAAESEERALECLRRAKSAGRNRVELERRLGEHELAQKQLNQEVRGIDERLAQLVEKRNIMRTRQSRAEALHAVRSLGDDHVEELFDRWEIRVTESEMLGDFSGGLDELEDSFKTEEEQAALREELAELTKKD